MNKTYSWHSKAAWITFLVLFNICSVVAQSEYDRGKVVSALQQWSKNLPTFDKAKPTLLFTTSTMGCTGCCASAINHILALADTIDANANILVVVATPVPKEGIAMKRLFKTKNVREDADQVLQSVFHTNAIIPDMYVVDSAGDVVFRQEDIQRNYVDTSILQRYIPVKKGSADTASLHSYISLQEGEDYIVGALSSPHIDFKARNLGLLETRQNSIYKFNIDNGQPVAYYPADTSIQWHFKKEGDREDWWADLGNVYQPLVKYDGLIYTHTDTMLVIAELFTHYDLTIDSTVKPEPRTNIRWVKEPCLIKVVNGKAVSVHKIENANWLLYGSAVGTMGEIIAPCVWEPSLVGGRDLEQWADSLYNFLLIKGPEYKARPVVRTTDLERQSGVKFNPRYSGRMCASNGKQFFYLNNANNVFLKGEISGDSLIHSLIAMKGILAQDSAVKVMDIATNSIYVHALMFGTAASDSRERLYVQVYNMEGVFVGEKVVSVDSDEDISVSRIVGYDSNTAYVLIKGRNTRWRIAKLSLSDLPS